MDYDTLFQQARLVVQSEHDLSGYQSDLLVHETVQNLARASVQELARDIPHEPFWALPPEINEWQNIIRESFDRIRLMEITDYQPVFEFRRT